jgi:hypothetical protein
LAHFLHVELSQFESTSSANLMNSESFCFCFHYLTTRAKIQTLGTF